MTNRPRLQLARDLLEKLRRSRCSVDTVRLIMFDELSTVTVCGTSVNCAEMSNRLFVDVSKNLYGSILFECGKMQSKRNAVVQLAVGLFTRLRQGPSVASCLKNHLTCFWVK